MNAFSLHSLPGSIRNWAKPLNRASIEPAPLDLSHIVCKHVYLTSQQEAQGAS
jgi:hypothetical protein